MTRVRLIALIAFLLVVLSQIPLSPPTTDDEDRESRESQASRAIVGNSACNPRVKVCEIDLLVSAAPARTDDASEE